MKLTILLAALLSFTSYAQAQTMKEKAQMKEIADAAKPLIEKYKTACGCEPKVTYDWKEIANSTDWLIAKRGYEAIAEASTLCTDADSKKAMCSGLKSVVIKKGKPVPIAFANGEATIVRMSGESTGPTLKKVLESSL